MKTFKMIIGIICYILSFIALCIFVFGQLYARANGMTGIIVPHWSLWCILGIFFAPIGVLLLKEEEDECKDS